MATNQALPADPALGDLPPPPPPGGPPMLPPLIGQPNNAGTNPAADNTRGARSAVLPDFVNPATPHGELCSFIQGLHSGDSQKFVEDVVLEVNGLRDTLSDDTGAVINAHALGQAEAAQKSYAQG